jgi:hypothetical protein
MLTVTQIGPRSFLELPGSCLRSCPLLNEDLKLYKKLSTTESVSIKQAVGLTQGQATSGQLYSLGIHPLNEELSALAHQHVSGILSAYIDDVKAHSAAELIADIIAMQ